MSSHNEISYLISKTQDDYKKQMEVDCIQQLFKLLKLSESEEKNKICLKLIKNQGVWKCKNCQKNKESIYCNECWGNIGQKHIEKKHKYEYIGDYICGTCDCGNLTNMKEEFVCSKHSKHRNSKVIGDKDDSQKKKLFINIHKELFSLMTNYINNEIIKADVNNEFFKKNINSFIDYISELSFSSKNLLNWIAELLLKNYPINNCNINHKCINIFDIITSQTHDINYTYNRSRTSSESNMMNDIYPINNSCSCPFLRFLIAVWPNNKINTLLSFSQNYDLKLSIGILYLFLYDQLILNEKNDFSYIIQEFLFSEIRIKISEHNYLLDNLLQSPKLIIDNYILPLLSIENNNSPETNKLYLSLRKVVNNLKFDILNLLSPKTMSLFVSDIKQFYLPLIDILAKFHNINSIKGKFNYTQQETSDSYNSVLIQTELSLLDIFTTMTSIIDFDKENLIKIIFSDFNEKISEKKYKNLAEDEYSYHISLFRGFSIFLNRYCFFFAIKNNSDITKGCEYIKKNKLMQNYDECFKILFSEMSKLFRFFAACGADFFIRYGEKMKLYEKTYYYTYKFVYRDFSLMKYLIPHGTFKEFFSLSSEIIKSLLYNENNNNKNIKLFLEQGDNKKYMKSISRLLSITLNIIRNNGSLIWNLGSSFKALQSCQIEDKILKQVIDDDLSNMSELTKTLIISKAIVEENSASFSDLYNGIYYILREKMGEETVENMVKDIFNTTTSIDQKKNYSLKDDYLSNIDTNYILSPEGKAKAEKYLGDFKKNQVSVFNRCFYTVNKYETVLTEEIYKKIFSDKISIEFIFDWIKKLIKDETYIELRPFFLNDLLNYFDVFLGVDFQNFKKIRNEHKKEINDFIEQISINNLEEPYKSYCDLIIKKVKGNNLEEEKEKTQQENKIKDIKKNLKEKFSNKNKIFLNGINNNTNNINIIEEKKGEKHEINKMIIEPELNINNNNKEVCFFCQKNVDEKDLGNCFGKLGYFLLDKFNSNSSVKILNNLFNKYTENNRTILTFNNINDPKKEKARKSLRIFNCGHIMHFSCFFDTYMKSENISIFNFICPMCKKFANTFIPKLNHILKEKNIDKNIYNLFKGYSKNFIINFRNKYMKNIKKFFKEKSEEYLMNEENYKKDININTKENNKFIEQKNYLIKNYKNIFLSCRHLIEGFFGIKEDIYTNFDLESNGFNKFQKDNLLYCFLQFRDSTDYFINCDKKREQIFLWKNMILSFRLMLKLNILRDNFFINFSLLLYRMYNLKLNKNIPYLINNEQFSIFLSGILFLICVLFEYEEIKGYEKYIIYLFLPVFSFSYFFRKLYLDNSLSFIPEYKFKKKNNLNERAFINHINKEKFYSFLETEDARNSLKFILKKITIVNCLLKNIEQTDEKIFDLNNMYENLNLSQLKEKKNIYEILDVIKNEINNEKNEFNNQMLDIGEKNKESIYNIFFEFYQNNNDIYDHKKIFEFLLGEFKKEINKGLCPKTINLNLLYFCEEINCNFIDLPEYAVEFLFKKYNLSCEKCKRKGINGLICLFCGKKVICRNDCPKDKKNKNKNNFNLELFDKHIEICGGGTGALLNIEDFSVIFTQQKKYSNISISLYLDKHGESIKENSIHNGFKLNKAQLKKAKNIYYNNDLVFG